MYYLFVCHVLSIKYAMYYQLVCHMLWKCCEAVLLHYIVNVYFVGDRCLQCYTLPVITFCLSLLNAIAGYFVFR